MKILLLEDDLILNEIIEEHLTEQGYVVDSIFDGEEASIRLYNHTYDLLLLDVNVPNLNGFELLKEIRARKITTPAIFITSLDMIEDIEKGFESGCDDYIKKPFELKELDLRINNIKRLFKIESSEMINIDEHTILDKTQLTITKEGKCSHITAKEMEVLLYFINHANTLISVEELTNNVWSYEESPSDSTVRTYIKNLRKILGEEVITNLRGVGYRFNK